MIGIFYVFHCRYVIPNLEKKADGQISLAWFTQ